MSQWSLCGSGRVGYFFMLVFSNGYLFRIHRPRFNYCSCSSMGIGVKGTNYLLVEGITRTRICAIHETGTASVGFLEIRH